MYLVLILRNLYSQGQVCVYAIQAFLAHLPYSQILLLQKGGGEGAGDIQKLVHQVVVTFATTTCRMNTLG